MATLDRFFTSPQDIDLAKDMVAKRSDIYIQKEEYSGSAVYGLSVGTSTLTPAVAPVWAADEFNSTVAKNLYVIDDNGKVATCLIDDTTLNQDVIFDEATLLLEEDGTTAATLTDTNTYDFRIFTPCSVAGQVNGPFFGYTEEVDLNITDEVMKYKYSQPAKTIRTDLKERVGTIEGATMNTTNEDMIAALFGADQYGSQTSQFAYGVGSNPSFNKFYRITFVTRDVTGRVLNTIVRRSQLFLNGGMFKPYQDGHLGTPFKGEVISDLFYPEGADMVWIQRAD